MVIATCLTLAQIATASEEAHEALGQSFAHPQSRLDLRTKYIEYVGDGAATALIARLDRPFDLPRGWKLNTRIQLTGLASDLAGSDNPGGGWVAGQGDLFSQLFLIAPRWGRTSIGLGGRFYLPTASDDQLGKGKYRVAPVLVGLHFPDWMTSGSFYGLGVRNEFSYAGDDERRDINVLQVVPVVNIALPRQSFVTFFEEIEHDWHGHGWFVPVDVEVGRKYAPDRAAALRLQVPLLDDLESYAWTLEARWSVFF
ncbi:MAG: hypothetical protein AB7Q81_19690 [Gammaproteobacteria bacterium]